MLSFTPESIDGLDISADADSVWILYRLNHQNCLIIGAFDSRDTAFAYAAKNGPTDQTGWIEPHPGQRHWQYESEMFTYFLERHQIRQEPGKSHAAKMQFPTVEE